MAVRDMKKRSLIMVILCGNLEAGYMVQGVELEKKPPLCEDFL